MFESQNKYKIKNEVFLKIWIGISIQIALVVPEEWQGEGKSGRGFLHPKPRAGWWNHTGMKAQSWFVRAGEVSSL